MKFLNIQGKLSSNLNAGFSLIELMVVVALLALISSLILTSLNSARIKSRDAKRIADINQISKALELYFNDKNGYPTVGFNTTLKEMTTANMTNQVGGQMLIPKFMNQIPTSPTPADSSSAADCSATYGGVDQANDYQYALPSAVPASGIISSYTVTFCLGGPTGSLSAGVHTLTPSGLK